MKTRFSDTLKAFAVFLGRVPADVAAAVAAAYAVAVSRWASTLNSATGLHTSYPPGFDPKERGTCYFGAFDLALVLEPIREKYPDRAMAFEDACRAEAAARDRSVGPGGAVWSVEHMAEALRLFVPQLTDPPKPDASTAARA